MAIFNKAHAGRRAAIGLVMAMLLTACGSGEPAPIRGQKPTASVSPTPAAVSGSALTIPAAVMSEEEAQENAERLVRKLSLDEKVSLMVEGYMDIRETLRYFPEGKEMSESTEGRIPESMDSLMTVRDVVNESYAPVIADGADRVMMTITSFPKISAMITPAFMSYEVVSSLLRTELRFDGVIYTPPLDDYRLAKRYPDDTDGYLAVEAVKAGCDVIYRPKDKGRAAQALRIAVNTGNMSEDRINASVVRIMKSMYLRGQKTL